MSPNPPAVALFDVDGTLIRTEGPSRHSRALKAAFQRVYGAPCVFTQGMHGMTDTQIYIAMAREMGIEDGRLAQMARDACSSMVELYQLREEADGSYYALPGVEELLDDLERRGVVLGLVTGNVPEIAYDKLADVGLDRYFPFGAFGNDAEDRTGLPPLAVRRAEELVGRPVDRGRVFVIGDTGRDVACALDNGLRAVAVGTGSVPLEELRATGAELVLPDLSDPEPLLRLMGLNSG